MSGLFQSINSLSMALQDASVVGGLRFWGNQTSWLLGEVHRIGGLPGSDQVKIYRDIPYTDRGQRQCVDLYLPRVTGQGPVPFVFFIHGGGWVSGHRRMANVMGRILASRGIGLVSAGYRLAPKCSLAGQLDDLQTALMLVHDEGADYGLDTSRYAIAGESAGGHLTMRLAQELPSRLPPPRMIIGIYGLYDFSAWAGRKTEGANRYITKGLLRVLRKNQTLSEFCDAHSANRPLPWGNVPVLLLHGEGDHLVDYRQSHKLASTLRHQGSEVKVVTFPGSEHAFNYFSMFGGRLPVQEFYGEVFGYIRQHLTPEARN